MDLSSDSALHFVTIFMSQTISKTCNLFMNHIFRYFYFPSLICVLSFATVIGSESLTFLLSALIYQPLKHIEISQPSNAIRLRPFSRTVMRKTRLDIFHLNSFRKTFRANLQEIWFCLLLCQCFSNSCH